MTAPAPPLPRWIVEPTVDADLAPEGLIAADCQGDASPFDGSDGVDLPDEEPDPHDDPAFDQVPDDEEDVTDG